MKWNTDFASCLSVGPVYIMEQNPYIIIHNTLRPRQNGRHFADDTFEPIFLNKNIRISIKISRKFVPKVPINNFPAFGSDIWTNDGLLTDAYMRHSASMCYICPRSSTINSLNDYRNTYVFIHTSYEIDLLQSYVNELLTF